MCLQKKPIIIFNFFSGTQWSSHSELLDEELQLCTLNSKVTNCALLMWDQLLSLFGWTVYRYTSCCVFCRVTLQSMTILPLITCFSLWSLWTPGFGCQTQHPHKKKWLSVLCSSTYRDTHGNKPHIYLSVCLFVCLYHWPICYMGDVCPTLLISISSLITSLFDLDAADSVLNVLKEFS